MAMLRIQFTCKKCGNSLVSSPEMISKYVSCKKCHALNVVPELVPERSLTEERRVEDISSAGTELVLQEVGQINPYSPPLSEMQPTDSVSIGLWAKNSNLIVRVTDHQFPAVCVHTNEPCDSTTILHLKMIPTVLLWLVPILAIANLVFGKNCTLNVPLKGDLMEQHRQHSKNILTYAWLSICVFVSGVFVYAVAMFLGANDILGALILVPVLSSPVVAIGLFAWMSLSSRRFLQVLKFDGTYATISGVHPHYLAELPAWDSSKDK